MEQDGKEGSARELLEPGPGQAGFDWFGLVLAVPDKFWGFEALGRADHPGAMVREVGDGRHVFAFKGTHAEGARRFFNQLEVKPDDENGLTKATLFLLEPRRLRLRAARLLCGERRMGRLGEADRARFQAELLRVLGPATGLGDGA